MVRLVSIVALLLSAAIGTHASLYCQCLFPDSSHCCLAVSPRDVFEMISRLTDLWLKDNTIQGCTATCLDAEKYGGQRCDAGGKFSDVSAINAQWRTACKNR